MFFNSRNAYCSFSYFYISVGKIQYTQTHRHVSKLIYPILSSLCMHLFSSQFFFCNSNELIFFLTNFYRKKKIPAHNLSPTVTLSSIQEATGGTCRDSCSAHRWCGVWKKSWVPFVLQCILYKILHFFKHIFIEFAQIENGYKLQPGLVR